MPGRETISFFEGENGMSADVAGQQLTGTKIRHPFLHRVPASGMGRGRKKISVKFGQIQTSSAIAGVTAGQSEGQIFPRRVRDSGTHQRSSVRRSQRNSIGAVD
jgi:hypothetical protein